tara:strand:- start:137 stop:379 length:243 start_codon:yes stop_codon:yes gene_type:complete
MNISKSIRVGLALNDMKARDVMNATGKSSVTVSLWVTRKASPKLKDVEKMAGLFGVPVSTFIEWGERQEVSSEIQTIRND